MSEMRLSVVLQAIDRISRPMAKAQRAVQRFNRASGLDRVGAAAGNAGQKIGNATNQLGRFAGKMALLGGAGGFLFKTQFLDVASAFERYQTILKTTEGSNEAAQKSMAWVNDFAAKTPFQLDEVVASFVKLRTRGLDPTSGLLTTLGDTAAAMGKSVDQAVEAGADAMTGEFERLKELGITSRTQGNKTMFEYVKNGETIRKVVDRRNKAMIVSTVQAIWNDQYAGAMDDLSSTWDGMMSNLSDQWTRFANMVMSAGVFDWMKAKLKGVLDEVDAMASSGELKALAIEFGTNLVAALKEFWRALSAVAEIAAVFAGALVVLKETLGGWEPVVAGIAAIIAGPFLLALGSATIAIGGFLTALMATPVGWFIAAVTAIVAVVGLIYENWGPIADWFDGIWNRIKIGGQELKIFFLDVVTAIAGMIGNLVNMVPDSLRSTFGLDGLSESIKSLDAVRNQAGLDLSNMQRGAATTGGQDSALSGVSVQQNQVGGKVHLVVEDQRTRIKSVQSDNPNVDIQVDTGLAMAGG